MRKIALCLSAVLLLATAIPLFAQSSTDTLTALLAEVRLLRIAMERTATAPQIQLLGTRLTVQNDRLQRVTQEHKGVRDQLQELLNSVAENTMQLQNVDEDVRVSTGGTPVQSMKQQELAFRAAAIKQELTILAAREPQLRAREAELAAAVAAEQNEWMLLNRRLDELERALGAR
jgi:uncharacterized protein (DUF3084 family)